MPRWITHFFRKTIALTMLGSFGLLLPQCPYFHDPCDYPHSKEINPGQCH